MQKQYILLMLKTENNFFVFYFFSYAKLCKEFFFCFAISNFQEKKNYDIFMLFVLTYFTNSGNLSPPFPSPADGGLHCYLQNQKITKKNS
jgi:hypothetical protein